MAQKNNYFEAFCNVSKAFGTTLNQSALLDLIVESAIDTMQAKAACLFMEDRTRDVFVPVAQKGLSDNYLHAKPIQAKKIAATIIDKGYLSILDATTDKRVENHELKKAEGIASILDVPVIVNDKAIGILALYTADQRKFSNDEVDFLRALADQGGMAIQHRRLLDRIRKNSALFLDLAANINSTLDIKQILHNLTADICEALGMKGAIIRLHNKETGNLDLVASFGLSQEFLDKGPVTAKKYSDQVMQGETVVISDVATDNRVQYRDAVAKEGIVSMLIVPIRAKDEVIGTMRLLSDQARKYPEDIIMLVNALAQTGGLAIQNASLYLALQNDIKDLKDDMWSHRSWF